MSRWEGLKSEKGQDRGKRSHVSGLGRNSNNNPNRWASLDSNAKAESSRRPKHKTSFRGKNQRQERVNKVESDSLRKMERYKNDKLSILMTEHDTLLNSLKSELVRYESKKTIRNGEKKLAIKHLTKILHNATNICRVSNVDDLPSNTDIFMALLGLLKITDKLNDWDDDSELSVLVVQTMVSILKVSETGSKTNAVTNTRLSKSQVEFGFTVLSSHYHHWNLQPLERQSLMVSGFLVAIALLTKNHVSELPPESTAQRVVGAIFIPYLSSLRLNRDHIQGQNDECHSVGSMATSSSSSYLHPLPHVCSAIITLLGNPSHASAILAPLVEDFSISFSCGIEEQETINPLRMELIGALLKFLEIQHDLGNNYGRQIEEVVYACRTLTASIDGIRKLRKGNKTENDGLGGADVQITKPLQKFILDVVTEYNKKIRNPQDKTMPLTNLITSSLHLLRALVACYPKAMTGIGWKLIIEGANRNKYSKLSQTYGSSSPVLGPYLPLSLVDDNSNDLSILVSESKSKILPLTLDCIADFILVLPWNKWLKQSATKTSAMMSTKVVTSGMYKNVADALCSLIEISTNFFRKCHDKSQMKSLGRLAKAILMEIPYCDAKLIRSGEALWQAITATIFHWRNHNGALLSEEKQNMACEILIASSGGTTTPQGNLVGMSDPAKSWFLSKGSSTVSFFRDLLDPFESNGVRYYEQNVQIVSSVLRTLPDIALQRWDAFLNIFKELKPTSNKKDLMRLEVLESFMLGRKDFEVIADLKVKNESIITDLDDILLQPWNQNALQRCMNIYSALRSQDWIQLDQVDNRVSSHLDVILSCCRNPAAKIREVAARAVGEFCTQYIMYEATEERKVLQQQLAIYRVHAAMLELCKDKNAGPRSMSIFSLGNLSSALKGSKKILETNKLHEMHNAMLYSFDDANDKVVKNAIRSVGHSSNLLAASRRREDSDQYSSESFGLLVNTIESLTSKLWNTLHVALDEEQKAAMTWKERSAAKKHGWGACHSLGLVFEGFCLGIFEECNELALASSKAAQCLIHCPCHHSILNEKVVLAAMAAICHLPSQFFINNVRQEILLGKALTMSILILGSDKNIKVTPKLSAQNEPFLLHLLNSASIADVAIVLADDRITAQTLGILYSWMVDRPKLGGLSSRAFEIFALALQHSGRWSSTVGFEQKFASRALQKQKQERMSKLSPNTGSNTRPEETTNDEDEADEL